MPCMHTKVYKPPLYPDSFFLRACRGVANIQTNHLFRRNQHSTKSFILPPSTKHLLFFFKQTSSKKNGKLQPVFWFFFCWWILLHHFYSFSSVWARLGSFTHTHFTPFPSTIWKQPRPWECKSTLSHDRGWTIGCLYVVGHIV